MIKEMGQLHDLQTYIEIITEYPFTLVGGCVRDVLHGHTPKDYDAVLCLGDATETQAFAYVQEISARLSGFGIASQCYMAYGVSADADTDVADPAYSDAFHKRYLACMKCTLTTGECIDLLFSTDQHIADHCAHHDCNVNMVWLDVTSPRGYAGVQLPTTRLEFRPNVNPKRVKYMQDKLKSYGY